MTEKTTIKCESVFSESKAHRYLLRKEWDKSKPSATVISICPSSDAGVSCDTTTMLITNNLCKLDYGGFELTNLYSALNVNIKGMKELVGLYDEQTDKQIVASAEKANTVIIAWGRITLTRKAVEARVATVIELLKPFADKLYTIACGGRDMLHPLTPAVRNKWELRRYMS